MVLMLLTQAAGYCMRHGKGQVLPPKYASSGVRNHITPIRPGEHHCT